MNNSNLVKRRSLLQGFVAGGLAAAFSGPSHAAEVNGFDEVHDIVIVGSGFAGLATAYSAVKAGLKDILILENMEAFGGNSCLCGGLMSLPLSPKQKSKGIKDSVEMMMADMYKAGRGFNHPELARKFASDAPGVCAMLDECGVQLKDKVIRLGGHSAPRALVPEAASGGGIVIPIHKWLKAHGVKFQNRTQVTELVLSDGKVKGVQCNVGYNWNDGTSAKTARIGTRSAVVVCTGGWGQDNDFIKTTMPAYALLECTSQPGATAEMLRGLLKAGALPTMLDMYQLGPWASPDEKGAGPGSFFADYAFAEGISINPKTGRRYMNELADRRTRAEAELKVLGESEKDKINYPIAFCSEKTTEHAEGFKAAYRDGCVFRHATVEDLAKNYEIPLPALKQQIAEYNEIVAGKRKDPFEKPLDVKQKLEAPFYSMRLTPKLHYCMGGIAITPKAEVISVETLKPIPGLYAAGEVTGGVHGMDRLGGCSSVDCLVFGLEAGKNAAALVGAKE